MMTMKTHSRLHTCNHAGHGWLPLVTLLPCFPDTNRHEEIHQHSKGLACNQHCALDHRSHKYTLIFKVSNTLSRRYRSYLANRRLWSIQIWFQHWRMAALCHWTMDCGLLPEQGQRVLSLSAWWCGCFHPRQRLAFLSYCVHRKECEKVAFELSVRGLFCAVKASRARLFWYSRFWVKSSLHPLSISWRCASTWWWPEFHGRLPAVAGNQAL